MKIACGSLCFTRKSFKRACADIATLGFQYVDIAVMQGWAHFNASDLTDKLEDAIPVAESALENNDLTPVALNASAGTSDASIEANRFRAICLFAQALNVKLVTYVAPVTVIGLERAVRRYSRLVEIAQEHGVVIAIEAHARTMLENPAAAIEFCEALPGIFLTLDASHMYSGENQGAPFHTLYPYVRHTHWRDGGSDWEQAQLPPGDGVVDFDGTLRGLDEAGYDGAYSVEYIDRFPNGGVPNIRAMKRILDEHAGA